VYNLLLTLNQDTNERHVEQGRTSPKRQETEREVDFVRIGYTEEDSNFDIWIDRWILNKELNASLKNIAKSLAHRDKITYFTDGSLNKVTQPSIANINQNNDRIETEMGAAFIVQEDPSLKAFARVNNWPPRQERNWPRYF